MVLVVIGGSINNFHNPFSQDSILFFDWISDEFFSCFYSSFKQSREGVLVAIYVHIVDCRSQFSSRLLISVLKLIINLSSQVDYQSQFSSQLLISVLKLIVNLSSQVDCQSKFSS